MERLIDRVREAIKHSPNGNVVLSMRDGKLLLYRLIKEEQANEAAHHVYKTCE